MVQISGNDRRILVTGATGFVGCALRRELRLLGRRHVAAVRGPASGFSDEQVAVGDIDGQTDWRPALREAGCVIHLAARTHVLEETAADPLAVYRRINVEATHRLAQQAAAAGVRRFVFLSSIKVNGEATTDHPFTENDAPRPLDAYGLSKCEAEDVLRRVGSETGMEVVILRPPLVYGAGVKGNFLRLLQTVARRRPLPLASIRNRRSLVYVGNLVDAVIACMDASPAAGKTFLASDGEDVSTPSLIRSMATALGVMPRLLPCPPVLLEAGAALLGKRAAAARLTGSLAVDSSALRRELGWQPRYSLDQGLTATAQWYHQGQN